jgi:hypothetical protein
VFVTAICLTPTIIINQYYSVIDLELGNMIHSYSQDDNNWEEEEAEAEDAKEKNK